MGERRGGGGEPKERGIKIFSEENEVMTKYPPGERKAEGVSALATVRLMCQKKVCKHTEAMSCLGGWAIQRKREKVQKAVLNVLITFCFGARKHTPEKVQLKDIKANQLPLWRLLAHRSMEPC